MKVKTHPGRGAAARMLAARVLLVLLFVVGGALAFLPAGRATVRSATMLPALITGAQPPLLAIAGDPIRHVSLTLQGETEPIYLDVYEPTRAAPVVPGAREGVLVISGVGDNRNIDQLVNLLKSMARSGIVAMAVTTPTLLAYDLNAAQGPEIAQAFTELRHWPGVAPSRAGILGFSAGGAVASLAAAQPSIRDNVRFLLVFGSYYNAETLLLDFGRRALDVSGKLVPWQPDIVPQQVLANAIGDVLPADQTTLLESAFNPAFSPLTNAQLSQLSPAARAAYHLLAGDQPSQAQANLNQLSPAMHAKLLSLSPKSVVSKIHAPVYVLHDKSDQYVPFTQSEEYARALAHLHHPHEFVEFSIFQHVEVRGDLGAGQIISDGWQLFQVLHAVLMPAS